MKFNLTLLLLAVAFVLFVVLSPWTNDWAQRRLDAADRECMATGFTQAQCDYIQRR